MQADDIKALFDVRLGHALESLDTAQKVMGLGDYKCAANRSYYAVFHAMRAVLVYDNIDAKKHSSIISEFRRLYIKTGVFDKEMSDTITNLFDIRTDSDYDDFFIISKEEVEKQVTFAGKFVSKVKAFLENK